MSMALWKPSQWSASNWARSTVRQISPRMELYQITVTEYLAI
jgi:hypothetical protein